MQPWFPSFSGIPAPLKLGFRVFWITALLVLFGLLIEPLVDPDVFIHLRDGRFSLETGMAAVPDPFSYTVSHPQDKLEWLFQILLYSGYRVFGFNGLITIKAVLLTLALAGLGLLLYRRWANSGAVAGLLALGVLSSVGLVFGERPFVFTYLFLIVTLLILDDYRFSDEASEPRLSRRLWLIPLLMVPWANIHPGFLVVFVWLGAHAAEAMWDARQGRSALAKRRALKLIMISGLAFIAGALNSVGFGIYGFVFSTVGSPLYMQTVMEWLPPELAHQAFFFLLLVLGWVVQLMTFRYSRLADLLPFIVFSYLAVKSRRNIPLFVAAALPLVITQGRRLWEHYRPNLTLSLPQRRAGYWIGTGALAVVLAVTAFLGSSFRWGEYKDWHPKTGLAWLERHQVTGRVFCEFAWGGFISWRTRGRLQTFMDGRLPFFGEELYKEYSQIYYGEPNSLDLLKKHRVEILLVSPKNFYRFFQMLGNSPDWVLVYWDHTNEIYLRRDGPYRALVEQAAYRSVDPNATPFSDPARPAEALAEVRRARIAAPQSYLPVFFEGDLLLQAGDLDGAKRVLTEAERLAPTHAHTLFDLGWIALRQNDLKDAERYLRKALAHHDKPDFLAKAGHALAMVLQTQNGREAEALRWARRALAAAPEWKPAQELVQQLQLQDLERRQRR